MKSKHIFQKIILFTTVWLGVFSTIYGWEHGIENQTTGLLFGESDYVACKNDTYVLSSGEAKKLPVGACMLRRIKADIMTVRPRKNAYGIELVKLGEAVYNGTFSGNAKFTVVGGANRGYHILKS